MRNKIFWSILTMSFFFALAGNNLFAGDKAADLASMTKMADSMNKERMALKEENKKLMDERGKLYEELGTAYTKAGLFDEAIDAYNKSLSYAPNNAQVHYYLGLLYQKSRRETEKAVFHFKKYLYMEPDAKNRDEVKYIIEMLLNQR